MRLPSAEVLAVYLCDRDAHLLRLAHVEGGQPALHARAIVLPGQGAVGQAIETGRAVVVPRYVPSTHALPELVSDGVTCATAVPIRVAARTIGAQVEEMSALAQELAATAQQLQSLVARFKLDAAPTYGRAALRLVA
jgi:signal transduction protein with GAF and PtsI domain